MNNEKYFKLRYRNPNSHTKSVTIFFNGYNCTKVRFFPPLMQNKVSQNIQFENVAFLKIRNYKCCVNG